MKRVLFLCIIISIVNILNAQSALTMSTKTIKDDCKTIQFKCLFKSLNYKDYDDYCIIDVTPIDSTIIDSSLFFIFGNNVNDLKNYIFTLIVCKKHERNTYERVVDENTFSLSVQTPYGMWYDYKCISNYEQNIELLCGCKLSIPISCIKTQLLISK